KLCERIGMRKEAHFIQDFWSENEWTDSLVYGMLSSDLK
ncbi:GNAT family N-acetyltransferase, partial [Bacillus cereus]